MTVCKLDKLEVSFDGALKWVSRSIFYIRCTQALTLIKQHVWYIANKDNNAAEVFLDVFNQLDTQGNCFHSDSLQPHPNPCHNFMETLLKVVTDINKTSISNYFTWIFNVIMWAQTNTFKYNFTFFQKSLGIPKNRSIQL